jgi:hypothetical protein
MTAPRAAPRPSPSARRNPPEDACGTFGGLGIGQEATTDDDCESGVSQTGQRPAASASGVTRAPQLPQWRGVILATSC